MCALRGRPHKHPGSVHTLESGAPAQARSGWIVDGNKVQSRAKYPDDLYAYTSISHSKLSGPKQASDTAQHNSRSYDVRGTVDHIRCDPRHALEPTNCFASSHPTTNGGNTGIGLGEQDTRWGHSTYPATQATNPRSWAPYARNCLKPHLRSYMSYTHIPQLCSRCCNGSAALDHSGVIRAGNAKLGVHWVCAQHPQEGRNLLHGVEMNRCQSL